MNITKDALVLSCSTMLKDIHQKIQNSNIYAKALIVVLLTITLTRIGYIWTPERDRSFPLFIFLCILLGVVIVVPVFSVIFPNKNKTVTTQGTHKITEGLKLGNKRLLFKVLIAIILSPILMLVMNAYIPSPTGKEFMTHAVILFILSTVIIFTLCHIILTKEIRQRLSIKLFGKILLVLFTIWALFIPNSFLDKGAKLLFLFTPTAYLLIRTFFPKMNTKIKLAILLFPVYFSAIYYLYVYFICSIGLCYIS